MYSEVNLLINLVNPLIVHKALLPVTMIPVTTQGSHQKLTSNVNNGFIEVNMYTVI